MPTTTRGRGTTRSTFGSPWGYSFGTGTTTRTGTGSTRRNSRKTTGSTGVGGYKTLCTTFEKKISSYKTLWNQAKGTGGSNRPSPATLNTFCNWINKGAIVQMCSPAQVSRWARSKNVSFNTKNPSTTACKNVLAKKFGKSAIKAVTRAKNGYFIVATAPVVKGKSFNFPR